MARVKRRRGSLGRRAHRPRPSHAAAEVAPSSPPAMIEPGFGGIGCRERLRSGSRPRRRLRALRPLLHPNSCRRHPCPGRCDLRKPAVLARAAHHHQSAFRARRVHRGARRGRDAAPRNRIGLPRRRTADHALPAPGPSGRKGDGAPELRGHDRHRVGQVALLLRADRRCRHSRPRRGRGAAHARDRDLPDERARQQPAQGASGLHRAVGTTGEAAPDIRALHGSGERGGARAHSRGQAR